MESLREMRENAQRMTNELIETYKKIREASKTRQERYEDALKYGIAGGLTPSA